MYSATWISAILWLSSAAVPIPLRFLMWALAIGIDISTAILVGRKHVQLAPNIFHLPERMGLFTLIVLGETIFGLVSSLSEHEWNIGSTISIGAGLSIAFSIWWMYFDNLEGSPIRAFRERGRIKIYTTWLYVHFPLVVGLVSTSAGIRYIVSSSQDTALSPTGEWLICDSVSLCLFSIAAIQLTTAKATENGDSTEVRSKKKLMIRGSVYRSIAGFVIVIIPVLTIT